jgi:hypothetical protein
MEKKRQKEMITQLSEGKVRNARIHIEFEGKELKGCACCICSPDKRGAGDETAKQAHPGPKQLTDDVMIVVGAIAAKT